MKYLFFSLWILCPYFLFAQCTATVSGTVNWSDLSWSCGSPPTTDGGTFVGDIVINGLDDNERIVMDISHTIQGNITINATGSNPTVEIPSGSSLYVTQSVSNTNNNVRYEVDGMFTIDGTLSGGDNQLFSGTGSVSGGSLILGNGTACGAGGCPVISFAVCLSGNSFCADHNNPFLPVTLLYFEGKTVEEAVVFEWQTLWEESNDFFTIERSLDLAQWETIARVEGGGNTEILRTYRGKDESPHRGSNYYRLKQTDLDGAFSYSGILHVLFQKESVLKIYPNPSPNGIFYISENTWEEEEPEIQITTCLGESLVVMGKPMQAFTKLDLRHLPKGIHMVTIIFGNKFVRQKIMIQ